MMTLDEFKAKKAVEDRAEAERDLRLTSQIAAKMRLEAAVLRHAGFPDNGRLEEADMLMQAAQNRVAALVAS